MNTLKYIVAVSLVNILSLSGFVVAMDWWQNRISAASARAAIPHSNPSSQPGSVPVSFGSLSVRNKAVQPTAGERGPVRVPADQGGPAPDALPQMDPLPTNTQAQEQSAVPADPLPADPPPPDPAPARCIILVDGVSYDVTDFRNIHGGGDIFTCGSDMSAVFWSQHDAATLAKMAKYRVQ